jgi:hypothetical protein
MARKRKTQPAAQLPELDKPAPFVPKVETVNDKFMPAISPGRPSAYDPKITPKLVKNMARQGLSEATMARILGVTPSAFSQWKSQYPAFLKALEYGREMVNAALERQRSSAHSAAATRPRKPSKPGCA